MGGVGGEREEWDEWESIIADCNEYEEACLDKSLFSISLYSYSLSLGKIFKKNIISENYLKILIQRR